MKYLVSRIRPAELAADEVEGFVRKGSEVGFGVLLDEVANRAKVGGGGILEASESEVRNEGFAVGGDFAGLGDLDLEIEKGSKAALEPCP